MAKVPRRPKQSAPKGPKDPSTSDKFLWKEGDLKIERHPDNIKEDKK